MLLSILIPTYNRAIFLRKNLSWISNYFVSNKYKNRVELIVCNNFSTDNTEKIIHSFSNDFPINLICKTQKTNIGLEKNVLDCLRLAKSEYIMFLGDDDYLERDYLDSILKVIENNKDIFCILPSTKAVYPDGSVGKGKDFGSPNRTFEAGFHNCLINARKGSQLSGVVHKRFGLLESYIQSGVSNIYPFIYFVGFNCMRGKTMHLFDFPVSISSPPQSEKDWNYGLDGLIPDIFDNFIKIPGLSFLEKERIGIDFLRKDHWRFTSYYKNGGLKSLNSLLIENLKSKQIPKLTKFLLPFIFYFYSLKSK